MKSIFICFLTSKNIVEVKKLSAKHFHTFKVIETNPQNNTPTGNFLLFPFAPQLPDTHNQIRKLSADIPDDGILILITDADCDEDLPKDIRKLFDILLTAHDDLNTTSTIINNLVDNKKLEQELDSTEKKYKTLVNNLPGITYWCKNDSDWTMLYMSRKTEKLTGYSAKAFINNKEITYSDIIVPQDREKVWLTIQKAIKRNQTFQIEYRIKTAAGRIKWVWEQGRATNTAEHGLTLEGVITDIDSQKKLEHRIELMREIVLALESSTDLIHLVEIIKQELRKVLHTFDIYLLLFDWEKREFLIPTIEHDQEFYKKIPMTKSLDAMVIKRNRSILMRKQEILKLVRQGKLSLDGKPPEVWLGVPLQINEKAAGIIAIQDSNNEFAVDETDIELLEFVSVQVVVSILKKRAEDETRKMLQAIDQSPLSVLITNLDGEVVYTNKKFVEVSGFSSEDIIGHKPAILNPYKCEPEHYQQIWDNLKSEGLWEGEYLNKNKSGKTYWESARVSSIKNARNKTTHYLYISEEITARKKIENELKKAKNLAEESDKLKTAFLANMSHEIRTPMNAILGFTDMLRNEEYKKEEHEEFLSLIEENSKKLLNTIDNIIDIAKIEAGQLTISHTRCSANKILYDNYYAFDKKKIKLDKSQIKFTAKQYKEDENFFFMSDPIRINQVLSNLIENAFKYTYEGEIELGYTFTKEGDIDYLIYYVRDSGQGVSKSSKESIFNQFTQESDDYRSTSGGTGLGLAISRNIARLMNGDIRLDSTVGKGSVFHFMIPFIQQKQEPLHKPEVKKKAKSEHEYPDKTILIAEDEDSNYKLLEVMLRKTHVRIIRAYNGKQAIDYVLGGNDVDLVLMDVRMPVMNGYEATEHIKKYEPKLPVIIQTAFALSGDRETSFEAGCDAYLSKPINANELYRLMKKFFN